MRNAARFAVLLAVAVPAPAAAGVYDDAEPASFHDVCDYIARNQAHIEWPSPQPFRAADNTFLKDHFVRYGFFDLDGDGIAEHVVRQQNNGTMGGDGYDFTLSSAKPGQPPPDPAADLDIKALPPASAERYSNIVLDFGEAWLPYDGRFYDVAFSDESGAFVQNARYFKLGGAEPYACVFENDVSETWERPFDESGEDKRIDDLLCPDPLEPKPEKMTLERIAASERLPKSSGVKPIPILGGNMMPACEGIDDPDCKDVWRVDFDNDGVRERVVKLVGDSGAGRGCDEEAFLLLTPDDRVATGREQALLNRMQGGNGKAFADYSCSRSLDWVVRKGRTLLEWHPEPLPGGSEVPRNQRTLSHALWLAQGNKARGVCYASYVITPRIVYDRAPVKP